MVERRTRALFEFAVAAITVVVRIRLWRALLNDDESETTDERND